MQAYASTLNENQRNKSLSAKKAKGKKIRPVLASQTSFKGYEVPKEHEQAIEEKMVKYNLYEPPVIPKWSELKELSKEDRKILRKALAPEIPSREHICLGMNETTRAIENKTATVVLIAGKIQPQIISKHIYECCDAYKIPLIKVDNLREASKKSFGFSVMCMAFKKVPSDAKIYEFYKFVQYWFVDELLKTPGYEDQNESVNKNIPPIKKTNEIMEIDVDEEEDIKSNVYLYRNNKSSRKFVPEPQKEKINQFNSDFIAFDGKEIKEKEEEETQIVPFPSKNESNVSEGPSRKKQKFGALKLKKIQKNENRKFVNLEG